MDGMSGRMGIHVRFPFHFLAYSCIVYLLTPYGARPPPYFIFPLPSLQYILPRYYLQYLTTM